MFEAAQLAAAADRLGMQGTPSAGLRIDSVMRWCVLYDRVYDLVGTLLVDPRQPSARDDCTP